MESNQFEIMTKEAFMKSVQGEKSNWESNYEWIQLEGQCGYFVLRNGDAVKNSKCTRKVQLYEDDWQAFLIGQHLSFIRYCMETYSVPVPVDIKSLNGFHHAAIGGLSGMTEICMQQPTIAIKNAMQQNKPILWKPSFMYRGLGVSCVSVAPIVAIQFGVNGMLGQALMRKNGTEQLTSGEKMGIAGTAGWISALVGGPAELVMTMQQRTGKGFMDTVKSVVDMHGAGMLKRGMMMTACRDSVWSASYLALGPMASMQLHEALPNVFGPQDTASLQQRALAAVGGSAAAGLVTVMVTQPLDTVKTVMQGQLADGNKNSLQSLRQTTAALIKQGGVKALYKGTLARGGRLVGGIMILGQAKVIFEDLFKVYIA